MVASNRILLQTNNWTTVIPVLMRFLLQFSKWMIVIPVLMRFLLLTSKWMIVIPVWTLQTSNSNSQ
ncbi:hypothetical protein E2C01_062633 [Portunus trituberculatus]|uniref:Uncharacterized protein n=1 Tax=Portunus trituberculatus TaxID=210409 RepID=A0A5B7H6X1_PORTR|nr:hypothetical protein [Portunus trituberculatus]